MRQIVLDTETTGLEPSDGHRIIEIGCVELINRKRTGNELHQYLQPDREIDPGAIEVHGISNEFLADKPRFGDIVHDGVRELQDINRREFVILASLAAVVLLFGIWPAPLVEVMHASIDNLITHVAVSKLPAETGVALLQAVP